MCGCVLSFDSEGPTQLGVGETVDDSARIDLSEFYVDTETQLDQPIAIPSANMALQKSPASLKTVSESSDDEDNILVTLAGYCTQYPSTGYTSSTHFTF